MNPERAQIAALCRLDSWQRLRPRLAALHVSPDVGPELIVDWLEQAFVTAQPEARRVRGEIARKPWRVEALTGRYDSDPRLGFRIATNTGTWWLQLKLAPRVHIHRIEPLRGSLS